MSRFHILFALSLSLAACVVSSDKPQSQPVPTQHKVVYIDQNHDGITDGLDVNADGRADYLLNCPACVPGQSPVCSDPLIDTNGDGIPDGLDLDCDGKIDIAFGGWGSGGGGGGGSGSGSGSGGGGGGGGGGGESACQVAVSVNGNSEAVQCTTYDGTSWSCQCSDNGNAFTCSTVSSDPCSIPGGNCCGF